MAKKLINIKPPIPVENTYEIFFKDGISHIVTACFTEVSDDAIAFCGPGYNTIALYQRSEMKGFRLYRSNTTPAKQKAKGARA